MTQFEHLAQLISDWCAADPVRGASIAVVADGAIAFSAGFGHYATPVAADTPFEAGSLTKPLFAYAVLQLVAAGVLDLDTPLADYLPYAYVPAEPHLPRMTARHALSHSTGFPNWRDPAGLRAAFPPGSAFSYSGEGYLYLQTVVARVAGQDLPAFLADRVFLPLGMAASSMMLEDWSDFRPHLPRGLRAYAAGSLKTTATDFARFLLATLHPDATAPLPPNRVEQLLTPQVPVGNQPGLAWGLGWGLQTDAHGAITFWQWGGSRDRTRNLALGDRARQTAVVILTNSLAGLPLCEQAAELALGHTGGYPAFRWLLPVDRWRADGRRV